MSRRGRRNGTSVVTAPSGEAGRVARLPVAPVEEAACAPGAAPVDLPLLRLPREVESGDVVVAALGGELTVKRVRVKSWRGGRAEALWLVPENEAYPLVAVTAEMEFSVWGVVTAVVHTLTRDGARRVPEGAHRARGDGRAGDPPRIDG